jgi:hypothetical protein
MKNDERHTLHLLSNNVSDVMLRSGRAGLGRTKKCVRNLERKHCDPKVKLLFFLNAVLGHFCSTSAEYVVLLVKQKLLQNYHFPFDNRSGFSS